MGDKEDLIRKVDSHLLPLLDAEIAKGFQPYLVTFPSQNVKTKECRSCGATKAPSYGVTMAGRELLDEKVYAYCIAMMCRDCGQSKEKMDRFLDRVEERYRECSKSS